MNVVRKPEPTARFQVSVAKEGACGRVRLAHPVAVSSVLALAAVSYSVWRRQELPHAPLEPEGRVEEASATAGELGPGPEAQEGGGRIIVNGEPATVVRLDGVVAIGPLLEGKFVGEYDSLEELEADVLHICLTFVGEYDDFIRKSVWWEVDGVVVERVPYELLKPSGTAVSPEAALAADAVQASYELGLTHRASRVYDILNRCAEDYSSGGMRVVPAGEPVRPTIEEPHNRSLYSAYHVMPLGEDYKGIVEFRSAEYPELQEALRELGDLREQRDTAVSRALGA